MPHGSPFWQGMLLLAAIFFLLWETWRGWRAGLVRSGMQLAAIVLSSVVGYAAGQVAAAPFGGPGDATGFCVGVVVGGGLALVVFVLIWILGAVLFKRTEHQGSGLIRLFWGFGGAVFGFLLGIVLLWGGISVVRALGALGEARVAATAAQERAAAAQAPAGQKVFRSRDVPAPRGPSASDGIASGLATLKQSLELGPAGKFVESVDVLPPDFYELLVQIGQVTGDQSTMLRFLQYPGIQEIIQSPRIVELVNDPAVIKAAQDRNFLGLMGNKALLKAVEDPELAKQLGSVDLRAALKFALESAPASPSPSPHTHSNPP